jgi:hypothetical protein
MAGGISEGHSHLGNRTEFLPFHTHDFATLEIDTDSVTVQRRKSHREVAFLMPNFNGWTNLAINRLERRI